MADPFTTALSAAFSLIGGLQQFSAANAEAALARSEAEEEAERQRRQSARALGRFRAQIGASGVQIEGSPLEILADLKSEGELKARDALFAGRRRVFGAKVQAGQSLLSGISGAARPIAASVRARGKDQ